MIFGEVSLDDALGSILAHTTRVAHHVLPKGAVLDAQSIMELRRAGLSTITAARLELGDVQEDQAAERLAKALCSPGIVRMRTGTGRTNLAAAHAGLFRADAASIDALNSLHESLTVATLPDATPVAAGELLVTVKIIPFAIAGSLLLQAEALARRSVPLRLPPFHPLRVGLVVTMLPGLKQSVTLGTIDATKRRVARFSGTLLPALCVPHNEAAIAEALLSLMADGAELLLVAGASATVDRGDVGPSAIVLLGGVITHFGMPVDPGNLICVGRIGTIPALVLPGCARSLKLNGIDLVLARLFADEAAGPAEIGGMGVGGLLKDFAARPSPRTADRAAPRRIAGLVLAAGLSSRMAPANKLLAKGAGGETIVGRVADALVASKVETAIVVVGHAAEQVVAALAGRPVTFVQAPDYTAGLSASLRAGIAALPSDISAALVCLGDMPLVTPQLIDQVIDAYDPGEGRAIVVPTHRGKRGNPVLWDRRFFADILALTGDTGARALLMRHAEYVVEIEVGSEAVLTDFDTPEALSALP